MRQQILKYVLFLKCKYFRKLQKISTILKEAFALLFHTQDRIPLIRRCLLQHVHLSTSGLSFVLQNYCFYSCFRKSSNLNCMLLPFCIRFALPHCILCPAALGLHLWFLEVDTLGDGLKSYSLGGIIEAWTEALQNPLELSRKVCSWRWDWVILNSNS